MDWWIEDGWLAEERPAVCLARSDYKKWPLEKTAMGGGWLLVERCAGMNLIANNLLRMQ